MLYETLYFKQEPTGSCWEEKDQGQKIKHKVKGHIRSNASIGNRVMIDQLSFELWEIFFHRLLVLLEKQVIEESYSFKGTYLMNYISELTKGLAHRQVHV